MAFNKNKRIENKIHLTVVNNSKLINVLRTFSKNEMKEFEKLVSSPYFNKGRNYLPFLAELKKFYPKFDDEKLNQEYIYFKLFPGKKYNKQIIWNMSSALLNMTEEFMIHNSLKKNKFVKNYVLAEEYHEKKLSRYLAKITDEMDNKLNLAGIDSRYFMSKSQIEFLRKAHNFLEDTQHLIPKHIVKQGEFIILDFLRTISGVITDMDTNFFMFNARFDINLPYNFMQNLNLKEIINYAKMKSFRYAWIMEMCYCSIMMILEQDSLKYFTELKILFKEHFNKLTRDEKNVWLTVLSNYCASESRKNDYFLKELFEINKLTIKEGVLLENTYFYKIKFMQILRNALAINETQWARNFIEKFVPKLKPSYQKSMRALSLAYLSFNLKNFEEVLENLKNVKFIDSRDKLHVRNLYIRTYYELNEIEAVISQIDSTKHFLNKSALYTHKTKSNYFKSLNLLNRLINAKYNNNINEIELILNTVEEDKGLILGSWLKEKIGELKKGAKQLL